MTMSYKKSNNLIPIIRKKIILGEYVHYSLEKKKSNTSMLNTLKIIWNRVVHWYILKFIYFLNIGKYYMVWLCTHFIESFINIHIIINISLSLYKKKKKKKIYYIKRYNNFLEILFICSILPNILIYSPVQQMLDS